MAIIKFILTAFLITNFVIIVQTSSIIPCETDADCEEFKNATCFEKFCKCSNSTTNSCKETDYTVKMKIGASCTVSAACNIEGAICHQEKCICKPGMVAAFNERKCLNVSEGIGSYCIESVQCYKIHPFSGCQQNKCTCQQHAHEDNGSCYQDVALGGVCSIDANCTATEHSKCIQNKCKCENEFIQNGNTCLPISKSVKDACTVDGQCVASLGGASFCDNGFCSCKELYQLKVGVNKCVRDMLLNENCVKHSECHGPTPGESRLECILGVCKCRSFFKEEYGYCINGASSSYSVPLMLFLIVDVFLLIFY